MFGNNFVKISSLTISDDAHLTSVSFLLNGVPSFVDQLAEWLSCVGLEVIVHL